MSIIIGIDHGYYAIKTVHCSFPAGLTSYGEHEPYTRQGLLEFGGCFFVCGTGRQPIQRDKTANDNYAIVPLLAQVEYPADGAVSEIILPDDVELLSYQSTDYEPIPADEQEQAEILHQTYSEQSAAATGLYVKASADFTAQLVYTDSDGSSQSKIKRLKKAIEDSADRQEKLSQPEMLLSAKDLQIQEYDDALTARIIEKITVRSRNEIEIRFIGGYEKAMPLE
uniref:hypothetical protein n=1 Tax=Gemmiger formicilis TaxID=745368 RepID=UPI003FF07D72